MSKDKNRFLRRKKKADTLYSLSKLAFWFALAGLSFSWYQLINHETEAIKNWWYVGRFLTYAIILIASGSSIAVKRTKYENEYYDR